MINLTTKVSSKIAERFAAESYTQSLCGTDYEFTGAKTIKVMSVDTVPENEYQRSGTNRYGTPVDLGDTEQELTMSKTAAFTMVIDKLNGSDQAIVKSAARAIRRQTDEVSIPNTDKYRIKRWCEGANVVILADAAPTKATIVEMILAAATEMDNRNVPKTNRTVLIPASNYLKLSISDEFIQLEKLGVKSVSTGDVGMLDNMKVKKVPDSYFPKGVHFMIKVKSATVDPMKVNSTKVHQDPPGIAGALIEGLRYYDAFVLGAKGDGVAVCGSADFILAAPAITVSESTHKATVAAVAGVEFHYTTDGTNPRYSDSAKVYTGAVDLAQGETIKVVGFKDGAVGILAEAEYK